METTKSTKLIAKANMLKLEANYKYIKKLARMSSNDPKYIPHLTWSCQAYLVSLYWPYEENIRPFFSEDTFQTVKHVYIKNIKDEWIHECTGSVPYTGTMSAIYEAYYHIKHNSLESIKNRPVLQAIAKFLMDENVVIKNICNFY